MPTETFTGAHRVEDFLTWKQEMKRWAAGFSIELHRTIPARGNREASIAIEYTLPEGSYGRYSKCGICGESLLGRELPEEPPVRTISGERLGT